MVWGGLLVLLGTLSLLERAFGLASWVWVVGLVAAGVGRRGHLWPGPRQPGSADPGLCAVGRRALDRAHFTGRSQRHLYRHLCAVGDRAALPGRLYKGPQAVVGLDPGLRPAGRRADGRPDRHPPAQERGRGDLCPVGHRAALFDRLPARPQAVVGADPDLRPGLDRADGRPDWGRPFCAIS